MILAASSSSSYDELCQSSTHTRDAPPAKPLSSRNSDEDFSPRTSASKSSAFLGRRSVHFPPSSEEATVISSHQELLSSEELHARWCSPQEYQQFRQSRVKCVQKLLRESPVYTHVVEQVHGICCQHMMSPLDTILDDLFEADEHDDSTSIAPSVPTFPILNESEMKQLSQIYRKPTFVGLERVSVKTIALDKQHRRNCLTHSVRHLQQAHAHPKVIRRVCEHISQPSKIFARHIAVAQAA